MPPDARLLEAQTLSAAERLWQRQPIHPQFCWCPEHGTISWMILLCAQIFWLLFRRKHFKLLHRCTEEQVQTAASSDNFRRGRCLPHLKWFEMNLSSLKRFEMILTLSWLIIKLDQKMETAVYLVVQTAGRYLVTAWILVFPMIPGPA